MYVISCGCPGYRVYINNEPKALVSYRHNTAVLTDLLSNTDYRCDNISVG